MPVATLTVKVIFSSLKISQIIPIVIIHEVKYVAARIRTIPRKEPSALKKFFHASIPITFFQKFSFYSSFLNTNVISSSYSFSSMDFVYPSKSNMFLKYSEIRLSYL